MKTLREYNLQVKQVAKKIKNYSASNKNKKLRFYHGDTNSTREQDSKDYFWIDISDLDEVIEVNTKTRYAIVEPNVPMDKLVNETLKYNLIPKVVMEFPGITVGGQ